MYLSTLVYLTALFSSDWNAIQSCSEFVSFSWFDWQLVNQLADALLSLPGLEYISVELQQVVALQSAYCLRHVNSMLCDLVRKYSALFKSRCENMYKVALQVFIKFVQAKYKIQQAFKTHAL